MRSLSLIQGVYYLATGLWPLFNIRSFQVATGPKVDRWLVKTVGVLVAAGGASMVAGGLRKEPSPELVPLAVGSAAGLAAVDIVYSSKRRISGIYLLDAVAEIALAGLWLVAINRRSRHNGRSTERLNLSRYYKIEEKSMKGNGHRTSHHISEEMQQCINDCWDCHSICLDTISYCLQRGGQHAQPAHIQLLMDCSEMCRTSTNFMLRRSEHHGWTCGVCAEICKVCAEDCDRFGDDQQMRGCAEVCRRCMESCRQMAGMASASDQTLHAGH